MTREEAARLIDHTYLDPRATATDIRRLTEEARAFGVYAVCVNSAWTALARERLRDTPIKVAATVGFPLGACHTSVKVAEATRAVQDGAAELDMVMALGLLLSGDLDGCRRDIAAVVEAARGVPVKVILETGWLTPGQIRQAAQLAVAAGASFVKTSTGFGAPGATPEAVRLLRETVGPSMGVKASGGIRTRDSFLAMVEAGANRIGMSATRQVLEAF
jgi:deoxyribose-phosphate aldolase